MTDRNIWPHDRACPRVSPPPSKELVRLYSEHLKASGFLRFAKHEGDRLEHFADWLRERAGPPPFLGLLSIGLRPTLPIVELVYRFDSLEHAQAARAAFNPLVTGPTKISEQP